VELPGTVVVVTGASSGIGRATALEFARHGSDVVVAARRKDRLDALAEAIRSLGRRALPFPCDVGDWSQLQSLAEATKAELGWADVLVNNAGIPGGGAFHRISMEAAERVTRVNCLGVLYGTKAFLPMMLEAGRGHIVNVASLAGRFAVPGSGVYSASKHAVIAFSESLYYELRPKGIVVTAVNPGLVSTEGFPHIDARDRRLGQMRRPEDIAELIVDVVRRDRGPEVSQPRWLSSLQAVRVLAPAPLPRRVASRHAREPARHTRGRDRTRRTVCRTGSGTVAGLRSGSPSRQLSGSQAGFHACSRQIPAEGGTMIAYVFVRRAAAGFFGNLDALPEVDYASPTTGPYIGFVKLTVSGGDALQAFLGGPFATAGAIDYETGVAVRLGAYAPRIQVPTKGPTVLVEAAVLIRTAPGRAYGVLHDVDQVSGIHGSAAVAGSFDVLAIAYSTTPDGLTHVINTVNAVDSVVSTQTLLLLRSDGVATGFAIAGEPPGASVVPAAAVETTVAQTETG
jgi:uncharacterized protein